MSGADFAGLFAHFLLLSLLSVGGAITTASEMHRYLVVDQGWLDDAQFTASIALAQAAPGPNLLFVAVLGWNIAGAAGAFVTLLGILLPSTTLALWATRWGARRSQTRFVRAFKAGLAPVTIGLLFATGWVLADLLRVAWPVLVIVAVTIALCLRSRLGPLWLVAGGMIAGALGWA